MIPSTDGITSVADGVLRLSRAHVNCYLVIERDEIVLIDGGLPRMWPLLLEALGEAGARPSDISAVLLTHGHFDHVGMCDRLMDEHHVPVHVHEKDAHLARHPYRYAHESPRLRYPFRYPAAIPILGRMTAAGALWVKGVTARPDVRPGAALPGMTGLVAVGSPGHTFGHCGFLLPHRGILFSGDALVTLDPYTGRTGPRLVARAATADGDAARRSLSALEDTRAHLVLPGHGDVYADGVVAAARAAREEQLA